MRKALLALVSRRRVVDGARGHCQRARATAAAALLLRRRMRFWRRARAGNTGDAAGCGIIAGQPTVVPAGGGGDAGGGEGDSLLGDSLSQQKGEGCEQWLLE